MKLKRMKKVFAVICIGALCVNLAACGSSTDSKTDSSQIEADIESETNLSINQIIDYFVPYMGRGYETIPEGGEDIPEDDSTKIAGRTYSFSADQLDFTDMDLEVSLYYATEAGNSQGVDAGFVYTMVWQPVGEGYSSDVAEEYLEYLYQVCGNELVNDKDLDQTSAGCSNFADGEHKVIKSWYCDDCTVTYTLDEIDGVVQSFYIDWYSLV